MDELMAIGEFSERSGLSPKRLRSYAAAGVLVPAAVDSSSGYRYYSPGQLRDARVIDALRVAGVPLAEIPVLLRDASAEDITALERRIAAEATDRQNALAVVRQLLEPIADEPPRRRTRRGASMPTFTAAIRSETGRGRDNNEDTAVGRDHVLAVADGLGGLPAGEVASALAITLIDAAYDGGSLDELKAIARAAGAAITDRGRTTPEVAGMATTLCAVGVTADGELALVNVGDSRAYVFRDGELERLTDDHTIAGELIRSGELADHDASAHPLRNVLTRVLGGGSATVDVDGFIHRPMPGDRLLLCTDGLTKAVSDDEIQETLTARRDIGAAADALVDTAVARGVDDDVTVVVAELRV